MGLCRSSIPVQSWTRTDLWMLLSAVRSQKNMFFYLLIAVPHFDLCFLKTGEIGCRRTLQTHLLPSAAISDRGCTRLEIQSRTYVKLLLETEADGHYAASLSWKPLVCRTNEPMMQKARIKFSILHYGKKLMWRKCADSSFLPQSTDHTANKQGGTEEF